VKPADAENESGYDIRVVDWELRAELAPTIRLHQPSEAWTPALDASRHREARDVPHSQRGGVDLHCTANVVISANIGRYFGLDEATDAALAR
jgi:hypothetical protein